MTARSAESSSHSIQKIQWQNLLELLTATASIAMEISWILPWFLLLTSTSKSASGATFYGVMGGAMLVSYLISRGIDTLCLRFSVHLAISTLIMIPYVWFGIKVLLYPDEVIGLGDLIRLPLRAFAEQNTMLPAEFIVMLLILLVWRRGVTLSRNPLTPHSVAAGFRTGVVSLIMYSLVVSRIFDGLPSYVLYVFLLSSLVAMIGARMVSLRRETVGKSQILSRRLLGSLGIGAILFIAFATIAGQLATDGLVGPVVQLLRLGLTVLITISLVLLSPLLFLFLIALPWILEGVIDSSFFPSLQVMFSGLLSTLSNVGMELSEYLRNFFAGLPSPVELKPFILWGVVLLAFAALIRLVRLGRDLVRDTSLTDEEREDLVNRGQLPNLILRGLERSAKQMLGRLTRGFQRGPFSEVARLRRIYRDLMKLCADLGQPRSVEKTPLEFLPRLQLIFPEYHQEVTEITRAYIRVRYGQLQEIGLSLERLESAWERLRERGTNLIKIQAVLEKRLRPDSFDRRKP